MDIDIMRITRENKRKRYRQKFENYRNEANDFTEERKAYVLFVNNRDI